MNNSTTLLFLLLMAASPLFVQPAVAAEKKVLVAYFSHTGTTEKVALEIQRQTGGDLFIIETVQNYSTNHKELTGYAKKELEANGRPRLKATIPNLEAYDVVFVGYPIWWYTLPMPLFTFFESHNFSGKTIIPFATHAGSRMSGTEETIRKLHPQANVHNGFAVSRNIIRNNPETGAVKPVTDWLAKLAY